MDLATSLDLAAHRYPEAEALITTEERITYESWHQRVNNVARGLIELGIRRNELFAICSSNSEAVATIYFAVQKIGATAVFLNPSWKSGEIAHAMAEAEIKGILFSTKVKKEIKKAVNACSKKIIQICGEEDKNNEGCEDIILYKDLLRAPKSFALPDPGPDTRMGTVLYTSGTTGTPKGVCRTARSDYYSSLALIIEHRWLHREKGDYVSQEFKPPGESLEAILPSVNRGYVRYSPGAGLWSLREALAQEMSERGRPTTAEEIIVTPGAKFGIALTFLLFLNEGDEVIMPDPGYPPDEFWARYQKAVIKYVKFRSSRHLDTEHLAGLITPSTRLVILNTPQRPNGQIIENLDEIAEVLLKFPHVVIASDEIFSKIVYPPNKHRSIASIPELKERTVVIDTFSKSFVMTGLRIGWVVAPPPLALKYDILVQNSCTNVSTIIQEAALAALQAPKDFHKDLISKLETKRNLAFEVLSRSKKLSLENAQGAFCLFPKLPDNLSDKKAVPLLLENGVAVVPGSAFGSAGAGHIRLTFTLENEELLEGVTKIKEVIDQAGE